MSFFFFFRRKLGVTAPVGDVVTYNAVTVTYNGIDVTY